METKVLRTIGDKFNNIGLKIRSATTDDLSSLTYLLSELFTLESDFTPNIRKQRQGLASLMENDRSTLLVAEMKGDIIGVCTLQPLISTAEGGTVGIVEDLIISEKYRQKGIGAALLEAVEKIAISQGMSRLQLLIDKANVPANQFYDKHDWTLTQMSVRRKKFR